MAIAILYEDNHLIAVDKPAGMLAQNDHSGDVSLLDVTKEYLRERYAKQGNVFLGLVHRLDRPVSGVMLFAKTSKAAGRLQQQFADRRTLKLYAAAVEGAITHAASGWVRCESILTRIRDRTVAATVSRENQHAPRHAFNAVMEYTILASAPEYSLLLIRLVTGRKHQIRAQLSLLGMPIVGDVKYGARQPLPDGSICLHAAYLAIDHPVGGKRLELISPVPSRIASLFGDVRDVQMMARENFCSDTHLRFRLTNSPYE